MTKQLEGKVAVVTGAGSGIGRASASIMAARGAQVLVTDLRPEAAQETVDAIVAAGGEAHAMKVDAENPSDLRAMIAEAASRFGGVDIVHNNAALLDIEFSKCDHSLLMIDVESWDRILAVNLRSMMVSCQAAIPELIKRGGGSIINTASTLGVRGDLQLPAYSASKAGVTGLTRQIAAEFGKKRIRCNAVAPGLILTPVTEKWLPQELKEISEDTNSTPYLGRPEDIGATVAFLASDDARYITGQTIAVDGGATMQLPTVAGYREFYRAQQAE